MPSTAGMNVPNRDMYEVVSIICTLWNIPVEDHAEFRRITLGTGPINENFFLKIVTRGHYKQALTRILQQLPCP